MSEAPTAFHAPVPAAPLRLSAAVIPTRQTASGREVFWVERGPRLAFFAGFRAFPGGSVNAEDRAEALPGFEGEDAALRACAIRELFEETGVWLGSDPRSSVEERRAWREKLIEGQATLGQARRGMGGELQAHRLIPAGRWVTPPSMARRFDTQFYWVELSADVTAEVWPGELASGAWIRPVDALAQWAAGQALLHPPALHALRALAAELPEPALAHALSHPAQSPDGVPARIELQQGIRMCPLRTPTLPPATHTHCYLLGNGELLVVDPGSPDPDEQARLLAQLQQLTAEGCRPVAIFLTHHHRDHVGGAEALRAALGLPIWAHPETAARFGAVDRALRGGERIELAGAPPMAFEVIHTPGHAPGHLCLWHRASQALVCGDMLANGSTIIIDPPDGNMGQYLEALGRLRDLPTGALYPAHGAPLAHGTPKLDAYIAHRLARIEALAAALGPHPRTLAELVAQTYRDVPEALWPLAERSALASLEYLASRGRAARQGDAFARQTET